MSLQSFIDQKAALPREIKQALVMIQLFDEKKESFISENKKICNKHLNNLKRRKNNSTEMDPASKRVHQDVSRNYKEITKYSKLKTEKVKKVEKLIQSYLAKMDEKIDQIQDQLESSQS